MHELMDLLSTKDSSANSISDKLKDMLFSKSADKVDAYRSNVADSMFNSKNAPTQSDVDAAPEVDPEDDYNPQQPGVTMPAEPGAASADLGSPVMEPDLESDSRTTELPKGGEI